MSLALTVLALHMNGIPRVYTPFVSGFLFWLSLMFLRFTHIFASSYILLFIAVFFLIVPWNTIVCLSIYLLIRLELSSLGC